MQRNMKKIMAGALSVCLFATNAPGVIELGEATQLCEVVQAATGKTYSGTCGENAKWKYNTSTKTLTISGTGEMDDYTDPEDEEAGVEEPAKWRPWGKYTGTKIEKVVIGDGITNIGSYAFFDNNKLTEVKIGKKVKEIGNYAFGYCYALKKLTLGDKIEKIEDGAFYRCSSLKEIDLSENVQSIGKYAFFECKALEKATLGDNLQEIGEQAFYGCGKLKNIYFGEALQTIGESAFFECFNLKTIKLNEKNKYFAVDKNVLMNKEQDTIYFGAFAENTTCNVGANVKKIDKAVINHTQIENFEVNSENQKYYSEAGLLYLKEENRLIVCPKGKKGTAVVSDKAVYMNLWRDGDYEYVHEYEDEENWESYNVIPFVLCSKLEKIVIGKNIKYLDGRFAGCTSLKEIVVDVENEYYSAENGSILNKDKNKLIYYVCADKNGKYTMPSTVTHVEEYAFFRQSESPCPGGVTPPKHIVLSDKLCDFENIPSGLQEITLGKKYYNNGDFSWLEKTTAEKIKKVNVSKENPYFSSVDGVLYTKDKKKLVKYVWNKSGKVTISGKTTTIGEKAFYYSNVTKIVIPKTVKKIENKAFAEISSKATFYVPRGKKKYYKKLLTSKTGFVKTMTIKEQ